MWSYILILVSCAIDVAVSQTSCPDGWMAYRGSCYLFKFGKSMDFVDSEMYCSQEAGDKEGHLVEISDNVENNFILNFLNQIKAHSWWIGLSDRDEEHVFQWTGSRTEPNYTNWFPGQPHSSTGRDQDCILIQPDMSYMWNDVSCVTNAFPICEIRVVESALETVG